jgi:NADPH-dependent 2,4-dienoyl-CoA reductase/sulfur reductase-like enzyme
VHVVHSMGDTFAVMNSLTAATSRRAVIIGAGYLGIEMAEALILRGMEVTQVEQLPQVLPTVDPELGRSVAASLRDHGVEVVTETAVQGIARNDSAGLRLRVEGASSDGTPFRRDADIVLIFAGVRPDVALAEAAGARLGIRGAIDVDRMMRTNLPDVFAAGDCVVTHHRLLETTYIPLGTTAHKQGRIAGENAVGGSREYAGSLGTQVVKVFDMAAARTGLRDHEAVSAGFDPVTVAAEADDHKAYYPGSHRIAMRWTGDRKSGRLLGLQLFGHRHAEVAKRVDIAAAAIFNDMKVDALSELDLSYTPPLGSPWDALQIGAQAWVRAMGAPRTS